MWSSDSPSPSLGGAGSLQKGSRERSSPVEEPLKSRCAGRLGIRGRRGGGGVKGGGEESGGGEGKGDGEGREEWEREWKEEGSDARRTEGERKGTEE